MQKILKIFYFLFFLGLAACTSPSKPTELLATVGEEKILVKDLQESLYRDGEKFGLGTRQNKEHFQRAKRSLLEELIRQKVLKQEAFQQGVNVSESELEQEIRKYKSRYTEREFQEVLKKRKIDYGTWRELRRTTLLVDKWIKQYLFADLKISPEEVETYYKEHELEFTRPEAVRVRQIVTDSREKAEEILKRVQEWENFARLARDVSIAPDRKQGGDLGFIVRGSFPKEFDVCFDLKEGEISPIVQTIYGFHIFKVIEKKSQEKVSLEEVKPQIEEWLKEAKREEAFEKYYQELQKKYSVWIDEKILKGVRL